MPQVNKVEDVKNNLDRILNGDSEVLIDCAEFMGRYLGKEKRVTTSQIRIPFGEVKRMKEFDKYKLDILRAKLAYTSGRHKEIADLQDTLDRAIKKVNEQNFRFFKDFFEAIVAYHRKYGKE